MGNGVTLKTIETINRIDMTRIFIVFLMVLGFASCQNSLNEADAYGNFESDKTLVSAEAIGKLLAFDLEEGDHIKVGQNLGLIDTLDLYYKKTQFEAQLNSVAAQADQIQAQMEVQKQQLSNISVSKKRIEKMFEKQAATQKQMDDVQGQYDLIITQIKATETQNISLEQQLQSMEQQLKQIDLAMEKCLIINPVEGTVLTKLSMEGEIAMQGKPLYTVANLDFLNLKAYVSGKQLGSIHIGQKVQVFVDGIDEELVEHKGVITWISESSEFTPKTIQTREERVNLVYAIKVRVKNDGSLKIGMPGEVAFEAQIQSEN